MLEQSQTKQKLMLEQNQVSSCISIWSVMFRKNGLAVWTIAMYMCYVYVQYTYTCICICVCIFIIQHSVVLNSRDRVRNCSFAYFISNLAI